MRDIGATARAILADWEAGNTMTPPSAEPGGLDLPTAYRIAAAVAALRRGRGEQPVGRKLAFSNRAIWGTYGMSAPLWSPLFAGSVAPLPETFVLGELRAPRIEPEIVLRLAARPEPGMGPASLIGCVAAVAHGFEIVTSPYGGWRFGPADVVAGLGLHGALLHGPFVPVTEADRADWAARLGDFSVTLLRDGAPVETGRAANVVGAGPLAALGVLARMLAEDPGAPPLEAGEVITTGTLTDAHPVAPGQTWTTRLDGLPLPGLALTLA